METIDPDAISAELLEHDDESEPARAVPPVVAVMVTHDVNEAVYLSERVLVMSQRPGRIVQEFPIALDRSGQREQTILTPEYNRVRNEVWLAVRRQARA